MCRLKIDGILMLMTRFYHFIYHMNDQIVVIHVLLLKFCAVTCVNIEKLHDFVNSAWRPTYNTFQ